MSYNYVAEIKQYSGIQLLRYRIFDAWLYFYSLQYFTLSTVSGYERSRNSLPQGNQHNYDTIWISFQIKAQ